MDTARRLSFHAAGSPIYTGRDVVKYFEPNFDQTAEDERRRAQAEYWASLLSLKSEFAELKAEIERERRKQEVEFKRQSDLRWRRFLKKAKAIFDERQAKAGFNPDQPRVPAGDRDGGQWTSGGGGDNGLDPPNGTATWKPRAQYAETINRYSVNLLEEEIAGGHTYSRHVGKSDGYLLKRAREMQDYTRSIYERSRHLPEGGIRAGSFSSLQSANALVNSTLAHNQGEVDLVASGLVRAAAVQRTLDSTTGKEAYAPSLYSAPTMRETFGVKVIILHDRISPRGYRVHTAYPIR